MLSSAPWCLVLHAVWCSILSSAPCCQHSPSDLDKRDESTSFITSPITCFLITSRAGLISGDQVPCRRCNFPRRHRVNYVARLLPFWRELLADTCERTHAHTHTRTHAHTHTRTHAHTHTRSHAHTHTRTHAHTLTRTHAHTHTRTHAHTHTRTHAHTHTRTHANRDVHTHVCRCQWREM